MAFIDTMTITEFKGRVREEARRLNTCGLNHELGVERSWYRTSKRRQVKQSHRSSKARGKAKTSSLQYMQLYQSPGKGLSQTNRRAVLRERSSKSTKPDERGWPWQRQRRISRKPPISRTSRWRTSRRQRIWKCESGGRSWKRTNTRHQRRYSPL